MDGLVGGTALHYHCAGAVAEEDTGAAVGPVGDAAEVLGADHQAELALGGIEQALHGVQGVEEAGAGGVEVEADRVVGQAQLPLYPAGGGGHLGVRRQGSHHAGADLVGGDAGVFQSPAGGQDRHVGDGLALRQVVAVADAGAGGNPLVVRVDQRFQLVVFHFQSGKRLSASDDRAAHAAPSLPR